MSVTSRVATKRSPASAGLAQPCTPANSIVTKGWSPTTRGVVPRRNLERLAGTKNPPRAGVGFDRHCAFENNALVVVLAARRPGHRFYVLSPTPPRLVDEAGDVHLPQKHHLHCHER
jgi:hypothetical protein